MWPKLKVGVLIAKKRIDSHHMNREWDVEKVVGSLGKSYCFQLFNNRVYQLSIFKKHGGMYVGLGVIERDHYVLPAKVAHPWSKHEMQRCSGEHMYWELYLNWAKGKVNKIKSKKIL